SDLLRVFKQKIGRKTESFCYRYNRDTTVAEARSLSASYVEYIFALIRNSYRAASLNTVDISEISKELHFSIRRVDEYLRKLFGIPPPPKPLVRLFHLRKFTVRAIKSSQKAKSESDTNISSFLN